MNHVLLFILFSFLIFTMNQSCGIKKMMPKSSVLKDQEIRQLKNHSIPRYTYGSKLTDIPVIPFQIFGIPYYRDIIIRTKHPKIDLHEFAQIELPEGKVWIIKESLLPDLSQKVITDHPDFETMYPEIPLPIILDNLKIKDQSTIENLNLTFEYKNSLDEHIQAHYEGKSNLKKQKKRNASTLGHSYKQVMAVLDVPARNFGSKAEIKYNGNHYKTEKILGLIPFRLLFNQIQGGIATGKQRFILKDDNLNCTYVKGHYNIEHLWNISTTEQSFIINQRNKYRSIDFTYQNDQNDELLLKNCAVFHWNNTEVPIFKIHFYPSLPDLRFRLIDTYTSTYVMSVNGQPANGTGLIKVYTEGDQNILEIIGSNPWWIAKSPLKITVSYKNDQVECMTEYFGE